MAQTLSQPTLLVKNRGLLTVALMLGTVMQVLDTTIANVALPHMASSLGAAQNEITWVLTSYIVAAAIATPITGWLSDNFGRKRVFLVSIAGFVACQSFLASAKLVARKGMTSAPKIGSSFSWIDSSTSPICAWPVITARLISGALNSEAPGWTVMTSSPLVASVTSLAKAARLTLWGLSAG